MKACTSDRDAGVGKDAGQRGGMVLVRVHAAGRDEAHQMAGAARLGSASIRPVSAGLRGQAAVRDRLADARQVLHHDPAGADVQVADLGVAHLPLRQPDIEAGGAQEGVRAGCQSRSKIRRVGLADGVVGRLLAPAPAVEDDQHHGAGRFRLHDNSGAPAR